MNYQIFSPFSNRLSTFFVFVLSIVSAWLGLSAPVSYFFLLGFVFPIIISMRLHRLNETGTAYTLTENTHWTIYLYGFPSQEQRAVLKNPCFWSSDRIKQFFIRSFVAKSLLQCACLTILAQERIKLAQNPMLVIIALPVLLCLLYAVGKSLYMLYLIMTDKWQCESLVTETGSVWYQGFMEKDGVREPLFSRLL
ncbi:putative inner membrane protein [Buttiauxella brennerae ATCC 51605]|uniref:Putative inner membrane protein n=1 Tax=Buttiauxella brennerae ATCC 51605 TaxID=1354251 RepID=A0A1B7IVZ3_9ENTR|nr:hypothetical protein [Buttiauxella brennerae]OAT34066.1 putative inner membrane protein [Buttiauxella brennerae ATCC 51605]